MMNADTYDSLSADHRKCVDALSGVEIAREIGAFWDQADKIGLEKGLEMGLVITDASAEDRAYFKELTAGIEADVLTEINGRGVDGAAALAFFKSQL